MCATLVEKPDDVFAFAKHHFVASLPTKKKKDPTKHYRPIVVAGPAGVGKSTLIKMLIKAFPKGFGFSVSHTTREPNPGEKDGVNYHFTSREVIMADAKAKKFVEWSEVDGQLYGTRCAYLITMNIPHALPAL